MEYGTKHVTFHNLTSSCLKWRKWKPSQSLLVRLEWVSGSTQDIPCTLQRFLDWLSEASSLEELPGVNSSLTPFCLFYSVVNFGFIYSASAPGSTIAGDTPDQDWQLEDFLLCSILLRHPPKGLSGRVLRLCSCGPTPSQRPCPIL